MIAITYYLTGCRRQAWLLQERCNLLFWPQVHRWTTNPWNFDCKEKTVWSGRSSSYSGWRNRSLCHWNWSPVSQRHREQRGGRNSSHCWIHPIWVGHSGEPINLKIKKESPKWQTHTKRRVKTVKTKNDFYPKTYKERPPEPILQNKI